MELDKQKRKNEKGAAMVMVLLISLLLLTASAGLLMESSMNTQNVSDATAEQQAYNAAESGLQSTINVLRGHVVPSPLLNPSKSPSDSSNLITFRRAVDVATSNSDGTTSPKLTRWLKYNYKSHGSSVNDRIVLGSNAASYNEHDGYAYDITIKDPDRTGEIVTFNTVGKFYEGNNTWALSTITKVVGTRVLTITYVPPTYNTTSPSPGVKLDVSTGQQTTNFGSFKFSVTGTGTAMMTEDLRFQIATKMTAPYNDTAIMRGWIRTNKVELSTASSLSFDFDSPTYDLHGSIFSLERDPLPVLKTDTEVRGTVNAPEPFRLVITSVGYGPRGAKKVLEATIQKNFFNGLSAPATLTLVGKKDNFTFEPGTSANLVYSGDDIASTLNIPSIGSTNNDNLGSIINALSANNVKATTDPPAENIAEEVPFWLESATNLHETLTDLRLVADSSGRLFNTSPAKDNFGNLATGTGITYVEGDAELQGDGGGILVCTGTLTLRGNFKFRGLIIVTGEGGIRRNGAGNGFLYGNTVVAPYTPSNPAAGFSSPKYDLRGGGNSEIRYDSSSVNNGMTAVSNFVLGVAEK